MRPALCFQLCQKQNPQLPSFTGASPMATTTTGATSHSTHGALYSVWRECPSVPPELRRKLNENHQPASWISSQLTSEKRGSSLAAHKNVLGKLGRSYGTECTGNFRS